MCQDDIAAVPVGHYLAERSEEKVLIPVAGNSAVNWVDRALSEIIKKSQPLDRIELEMAVTGAIISTETKML